MRLDQKEINNINNLRPGDDLYSESIRNIISSTLKQQDVLCDKMVSLIMSDMLFDLSISNALDEIGKILTYLSQETQKDTPEFRADTLMANFNRISQLKLSHEYAKLSGLPDDIINQVVQAEISRLWTKNPPPVKLHKHINISEATTRSEDTGVKKREK